MVFTLVGCGKNEEKNANKDKTDKNEIKDKVEASSFSDEIEIEGLIFKNNTVEYKDNETQFKSTILNPTDKKKYVEYVKATITYKTEEGEEQMVDLLFYFGSDLEKNEEDTTLTSIDLDITRVVKVEYELYNEEE